MLKKIASDELNVKRNSEEFKFIKDLFDEHAEKKDRFKLVRLYSMQEAEPVLIKTATANGKAVFDLMLGSVMDYLRNRSKKLFRQGKAQYYFKNSASSTFKEFPFEIKTRLKGRG